MLAFTTLPHHQILGNPFRRHQQCLSIHRCSASIPSSSTASPPSVAISPPPILTPSKAPGWDDAAVSGPLIHRYSSSDGDQYALWYTARSRNSNLYQKAPPGMSTGSIGLALSTDGLHFNREQDPVLQPNQEQWWAFDTIHLSASCMHTGTSPLVRTDASFFQLFYAAGDNEAVQTSLLDDPIPGLRMRIGLAISKDGQHFSRYEGQYPSGAVLDVGEAGKFDQLFVAGPNVIEIPEKKCFLMHYHSFDENNMRFCVGRAISTDGFNFEREITDPLEFAPLSTDQNDFDAKGHARPCVVRHPNGQFIMVVETISSSNVHSIAITESSNAKDWSPLRPILTPGAPGSWDDAGVSHPEAIILEDGTLRVYFTGKSSNNDMKEGRGTCIGVAQSNGADWSYLARLSAPSA